MASILLFLIFINLNLIDVHNKKRRVCINENLKTKVKFISKHGNLYGNVSEENPELVNDLSMQLT